MGRLKGTRTEKNILTAFIGESQARNKYTYFASQAKKEGYVQIASIFEETAKEYPEILFGKINTEEQQDLAAYFQIRSIPTVMAMKEGIVVFSQAGLLPKEALADIIKQLKELDMDKVRAEIEKEQANGEEK